MIEINIPGFRDLRLHHLVLDYNGTLAIDGLLRDGVSRRIRALSDKLQIHVVTGDTFGLAAEQLGDLPVKLTIIPSADQAEAKLHYVKQLGSDSVMVIGNGRNDVLALEEAALGVAVVMWEGFAVQAFGAADLAVTSILDALDFLYQPKRLVATLRA